MPELGLGVALALFFVGLVAGALNAVAGGGGFLSFPALMAAGLPPLPANATNFVALTPSNLAALPAYRRELAALGRGLVGPLALSAVGGVAGAALLVALGGAVFAAAIPWLMGTATILYAAAPAIRRAAERRRAPGATPGRAGPAAILLGASVYGGFFGAGLGNIVLAALALNGHDDFHRANALKNAITAAICLCAIAVYGIGGQVSLPHALVTMAGAATGGWWGATVARRLPQTLLRRGVIGLGAVLTALYALA